MYTYVCMFMCNTAYILVYLDIKMISEYNYLYEI